MEAKENEPFVPTINDLPNEMILMILKQLRAADRIRMSGVCRRWNQLVSHFFGHLFKLHLNDTRDYAFPVGDLSGRIYKKFKVEWTPACIGWMEVVDKFAEDLERLWLIIMAGESVWNPPGPAMNKLEAVLKKLGKLKYFGIEASMDSFAAISKTLSHMSSVEEAMFTIMSLSQPNHFALSLLNGLSCLPNLKSVKFNCFAGCYVPEGHILKPVTSVEELSLVAHPDFSNHSKLFPNLKHLHTTWYLEYEDFEQLVSCWPKLETLEIDFISCIETPLEILHQLSNLRNLMLIQFVETGEKITADYSLLEPLLKIPTLEELQLYYEDDVTWTGQIPTIGLNVKLYILDKFVPRATKSSEKEEQN